MTTLTLLEAELLALAKRVRELETLTAPIRAAQAMRPELPQPVDDDALVAELCGFVGGSAREIMGPSRERRVVALRRLLVRHLRSKDWTWPRIAAVFRISDRAARKLAAC